MCNETATLQRCEEAVRLLVSFCRSQGWSGYDPYDALASPLLRSLRIDRKLPRTLLTQLVKRSPVNLRPLLGIKPALNPKGLALAARALAALARFYNQALPPHRGAFANQNGVGGHDDVAELPADFSFVTDALEGLRSKELDEACWGYNFDWQSRAFFAPRGTPNVVCTTFAAHAYLDWYEEAGNEKALACAESSCRFLLDRLNRTYEAGGFCFSYTPLDRSRVHNTNLLAAELLARVFAQTGREEFREAALNAARFTVDRQRADGSWPYGEERSQQWIDSFHTGFVIVSLKRLIEHLGAYQWSGCLMRGFEFYRKAFFLADSAPKYYHNRLYPIDVHSAAQAVITFVEMADLIPAANEMSKRSLQWAIENLQDPTGFFYFQRHRFYTIRIPFMRWSQAWMLYALSLYMVRRPVAANV